LLREAKQLRSRKLALSLSKETPSSSTSPPAPRPLRQAPVLYNPPVPETATTRLDRVLAQLRLYEHPLLNFSARPKGEGVEIIIQFKELAAVAVHTYYFDLHPRDVDHPQFEWSFQRQLYDALHDYFVEMFIRTPQDRADRRQKEL
jgi:hypothetical protein